MTEYREGTGKPSRPGRVTRREFGKRVGLLLGGGLLLASRSVAAATLPAPGGSLAPVPTPQDLLASLDRAAFAARVGDVFRVGPGGPEPLGLELVEVAERRWAATRAGGGVQPENAGECFSLLFRGPADRPLDQDTYRFEHPRVGAFPLFIVPAAPSGEARHYVAVINRLVS